MRSILSYCFCTAVIWNLKVGGKLDLTNTASKCFSLVTCAVSCLKCTHLVHDADDTNQMIHVAQPVVHIFFFFFFGCPTAYGVLRPGFRSKPKLWLKLQLWQHWILNRGSHLHSSAPKMPLIPLCHSGNSTFFLMVKRWELQFGNPSTEHLLLKRCEHVSNPYSPWQ